MFLRSLTTEAMGIWRFAGAFAVFENKCTNSFGKIRKKNDIAN